MLQKKRKTNKMPQPRRRRLRLGVERVDHLVQSMQVAPRSTRPVLGTNRFVEAEESKRKVMGGILCFEASSPQTQQSAEPGQSPTTTWGNLISFWWQKKRFSKIIHFII